VLDSIVKYYKFKIPRAERKEKKRKEKRKEKKIKEKKRKEKKRFMRPFNLVV
jgi:hypothetical protein